MTVLVLFLGAGKCHLCPMLVFTLFLGAGKCHLDITCARLCFSTCRTNDVACRNCNSMMPAAAADDRLQHYVMEKMLRCTCWACWFRIQLIQLVIAQCIFLLDAKIWRIWIRVRVSCLSRQSRQPEGRRGSSDKPSLFNGAEIVPS